jgi:putative transposase
MWLLGLPRSTLHYRSLPVRDSTLRIMARIDVLYLEAPCSGSRRMVGYLARDGIPISHDRLRKLMRRMGLRAIYQKPRTTVPGDPSERFPCLVDLSRSRLCIRCGPPISPKSHPGRVSSTWWRSWISSPETCSAGNSPTALTRSSVWMCWRGHSEVAVNQRSSTPIKGASSPPQTSWQDCRLRRSRSVGREGGAATTIFWWRGCGARSSMRKVYLHAYSDGREAEISLARLLWRYCPVRSHSSLGGQTPHEVYTEPNPVSPVRS